jgi:hypothetical protein
VLLLAAASCRDAGRLMTREQIKAKRSSQQDEWLSSFEKCPKCFVKDVTNDKRIYLFDAIVDCESTIRVGTYGDGGKWVCNPDRLRRSTIVYSFGVGLEITFDLEMASMFGADVYMFDPSPSLSRQYVAYQTGMPHGKGWVYFQPLGLGPISTVRGKEWSLSIEGKACPAMSFSDIAKALGHTHVDILKIDIEGGEYAALKQILADNSLTKLNVQQLLVEFHLWSSSNFEDFVRIVGGLKKQGYLLFRKELNPGDAMRCAELAFVRA